MLAYSGWPTYIFIPVAVILLAAWLFQAYWGVRTFRDAKDDIEQGSKVSEWLYSRFVTPIFIGLLLVFAAFESILQGGELKWGIYSLIGSLLLLRPAILIVIAIRPYELIRNHPSKTA